MNWQDIPVYIVNRNRYKIGFLDLVEWLKSIEVKSIIILDNASSYPPLLDYYNTCGLKVVGLPNAGPYAYWEAKINGQTPYIVTDADVVPDNDCPKDLIEKMIQVYNRYGGCLKVGPGIRIDNLPDHYQKKQAVIDLENESWKGHRVMVEGDCFKTEIDTTFALYYTPDWPAWHDHYRLAPPYLVEHRPWYVDSSNLPEEEVYYRSHVENNWSYWCK